MGTLDREWFLEDVRAREVSGRIRKDDWGCGTKPDHTGPRVYVKKQQEAVEGFQVLIEHDLIFLKITLAPV